MSNKYYTPKVEEFHVGFEYEIWSKVLVKDAQWGFKVNKMMFTIKHLTQTYFSFNLEQDLKEDKIRVKYLDRKDIESLGFKFGTQLTERTAMYNSEAYNHTSLAYNEDDHTIRVAVHNGKVEVLKSVLIKNKSELRKILIQAKILKDEN